ncbi:MAG: polysaccharide pyruvyl transferase family protein [Alphaproteobacteria bacterium]
MTHVMISGWYGHANSGDEAILTVLLDELNRDAAIDCYVLSSVPGEIDRLYADMRATGVRHWEYCGLRGLENLLRGRLWRQTGLLRKSRLFIFGGGSLLRDNNTYRTLFRNLDEIFLARLVGVPVFFYALGVGPFRSRFGKKLIGLASRCATVITVRDQHSADRLVQLGIPPEKITVVSDPAFLLADTDPAECAKTAGLSGFLAQNPKTLFVYPTVSLIDPSLATHDNEHLARIAGALTQLCRTDGYAVVFVPLTIGGGVDDIDISRRIRNLMAVGSRTFIVEQTMLPRQVRGLTRLATVNLTVRLHAMIYAVSCGLPCVPVNYEPKVPANALQFGLQDYVVELDAELEGNIIENVRRLATRLPQERTRLAGLVPALERNAQETFVLLKRLLGETRP